MLNHRYALWLLRILVIGLLLFSSFLLLNYVFPLPDQIAYSTVVLDRNGEVIHAFLTPDDKWRMKTELNEISPVLKRTLLDKEDKYFYYHFGINPFSIVRAAVMNLVFRKRTSGASTITMQVARMLQPKDRTYLHKTIEMFRALQLEWKYSKDEILQLYFNLVPYGSNIEGIKSASVLYFGKNPERLSLAEVTALSIIPNRPSSLRLGVNNDQIIAERNKWLRRFEQDGLFAHQAIEDALHEPLNAHRRDAPQLAPHLSIKLQQQTRASTIRTYLNMQMQLKTQQLVHDYVQRLSNNNIHNAAVVVIDNRTHEVVTYVGSADFNNPVDGGQVNGADALRQPGSALKPLVYGLCFDNGLLTPKMMMTDVPINFKGYAPENYDQQFHGFVTVEYALENSLNIPAVKALNMLGKETMINKLIACHFQQINRDRNKLGLSLVLGGCGVTLEEMTGLYSAFANGGLYQAPKYVYTDTASVKNASRSLASDTARILSPAADFMITDILSRLARPDLPVNWEASMHTPRIAWKTGTSYGKRDAWSIGYNKDYTVGVWVGNFSGVGVPELSGAEVATPLLFSIFNTIDYNSPNNWYDMPKSCGIRLVCSETGLLPSSFCRHTVMDEYIPLISPSAYCDNMREVAVSADEKISYCKYCMPDKGYKKKWYRIIPPDMQSYYDEHRIAYEKVPPHNPRCERVFTDGGPAIRFPVNGTEYLLDKKHPEPMQLSCDVAADIKKVYWYINNQFLTEADAHDKPFFTPQEGDVKISCTDDKGRNTDIRIKVRLVRL